MFQSSKSCLSTPLQQQLHANTLKYSSAFGIIAHVCKISPHVDENMVYFFLEGHKLLDFLPLSCSHLLVLRLLLWRTWYVTCSFPKFRSSHELLLISFPLQERPQVLSTASSSRSPTDWQLLPWWDFCAGSCLQCKASYFHLSS